jgi:hypothetical protein
LCRPARSGPGGGRTIRGRTCRTARPRSWIIFSFHGSQLHVENIFTAKA